MNRYINRNVVKKEYDNTVAAFSERFTDFTAANSVKNDDGSEYIIFRNEACQRVTIDYNAKNGDISLICSEEIDIKEFVSEYNLKQTEGYESRSEGSRFQLSFIKHILIPLALISVVLWYVHHVKERL